MSHGILRSPAVFAGVIFAATAGTVSAEIPITWVELDAPPTSRANAQGGFIGDTLYLAGGVSGGVGRSTFQCYDVGDQSWTTLPSMTDPRNGHGAFTYADSVYALGGSSYATTFYPSVERYATASGTWSTVSTIPDTIRYFGTAEASGKVYLVGGQEHGDWSGNYRNDLLIYDIAGNSWSTGHDAPLTGAEFAGAAYGSKVYTFGGLAPLASSVYGKAQVYTPSSDTWSYGADMPKAVYDAGAGTLNDRIYVVGGHDLSSAVKTVQVYNPVANTWDTATDLPTVMTNPTVASYNDKLYVSDGQRLYEGAISPPTQKKVIQGVPDYRWNYGCAPTSGGMVVGYWSKRPGYAGLAPGTMPDFDNGDSGSDEMRQVDDNGGPRTRSDFNVVDNVIASYEHVYDYWVGLNQFADNLHFPRHNPNCVADCMWSNQVVNLCRDGGTAPWEESTGLRNYARHLGYSFDSGWTAWPFCSFELVKTQVDLGHPVLIDGFLANQPGAGHTIVAYGYRDGPGDDDWIAVRDTWQNALGNGYGIVGETDAEGREWWKWANPGFGVIGVTTFAPHVANAVEKFLADTFDRFAGLSEALGYIVDVGAGNGTAEIVSSPTDPADSVLRLLNPDTDLVAIERSVPTSQAMDIEFEYLFGAEAKLLVMLDTTIIGTLLCPSTGPGSVGSGTFAHFDVTVVLSDFGLDPNTPHQLRLELTSAGDPLVYVDDLLVSNPNAVPEPAAASLLALSGLAMIIRRRRA